jgi:ABC-2 type transport system ATP-binding protein
MISIKDLCISYDKQKSVIAGLSLDLEIGQIHGIVGMNGSGKTTLLNNLFGLVKNSSGTKTFEGQPLTKKHIAYLPTENYFYPNITGNEYLALFINDTFDLSSWNELFELPLNQIIDQYSTGMKKKLALLGILKKDKPILILDEPFNGLDIETARIVRSIILKLQTKGKTILVTSHILETLTNMCNQIHLLENGQALHSKAPNQFEDFTIQMFEKIEIENRGLIDKLIP